MIENRDTGQVEPFLQTSEGKRIVVFSVILFLVLGALVYTVMMSSRQGPGKKQASGAETEKRLRDAAEHWKVLLRNLDDRTVIDEDAYESIYHQLRDRTQHELTTVLFQQDHASLPDSHLERSRPDLRGSVVPFRGTVLRMQKLPLEFGDVFEVWIRRPESNLVYRVHLLKPPAGRLGEDGTDVEGEGVYLTSVENRVPDRDTVQSVPVIMGHSLRPGRTDRQGSETADQVGNDDEGDAAEEPSPDREETEDTERAFDWRKIPAPRDYGNREHVISYWGKLLSGVSGDEALPMDDPLYHRMIRELQRVKPDTLDRWVSEKIKPDWLTNQNEKKLHRGKVVSFRGQYLYGRQLPVPGVEDLSIWEIWLRNQEEEVTYTIHSLTDVNFRLQRGTYLKGEGIFLQSPLYELKDPAGRENVRYSRTLFLLSHELEPAYPNRREGMAAIDWFELLLGGLASLFLAIFIVVVYMSTRGEAGKKTEYLRRLREGRKKMEGSGKIMNSEAPEDPGVDDETPEG